MVPMKSRESEGVPFANQESVTKHLADIGPWRVPKSGHVTIIKFAHVEKFIDSKKTIFSIFNEKWKQRSQEMQTLNAGCSKVESKIFARRRPPSRRRGMAKI